MEAHLARSVKLALLPILGGERIERLQLARKLGYVPNIRRPRSYNEKLLHRKFYSPVPDSEFYADKWKSRDFVRERVGEQVLNEVYGAYREADAIDFDRLPEQFAIKMNNASKRNILVADKSKLDLDATRAQLRRWLAHAFGVVTSERFYLGMEPVIIIERYVPHDVFYSLHLFHGKVRYTETHADPLSPRHWSNWYDNDWRMQPFIQGTQGGPALPRPRFLEEMIDAADRIGADFDYVRLDFYPEREARILFSEITLVPAAGYSPFKPTEVDFELGKLW